MQSQPIEDFYRKKKLLADFEITGGIPETWPRLCAALNVEDRTVNVEDRREEEVPLSKAA